MFSCDTIAVNSEYSIYKCNMLAKNSDRPTGEPQPLCFYSGKEYAEGEMLKTTYLEIPQVSKTYSVVGSRPYWIWGFEMGYNEKGLVIGNEAQGSRMEPDKQNGLLGMDMLRIVLERAGNASEAITVITELLKKYGQKARASVLTERTYENSFIIVDRYECWVLETAGREWVAKRIKTVQGISNCYSIRTEMDMASPDVEKTAREKRWLSPDEPFDFAKAYTGRLVNQPMGVQRFRRLNKLLKLNEKHSFESLVGILRDHYDGEIISERFGETVGTFLSICMHMRDWGESETTASLITRYDEEIGVIARYAPAQPCLSAYIPVYMCGELPEKMQKAEKEYDENSLWWQLKKLSLLVVADEERFMSAVRRELAEIETNMNQKADDAEQRARCFIRSNDMKSARQILSAVTYECTEILYNYAKKENDKLWNAIKEQGGFYGRQKEAIEKYAEYSNINL